eukprot:1147544-Pelagomonas_calceolata.AAC.6
MAGAGIPGAGPGGNLFSHSFWLAKEEKRETAAGYNRATIRAYNLMLRRKSAMPSETGFIPANFKKMSTTKIKDWKEITYTDGS